ncbi:hypothetical protein BX661DRAFT_189296 [Kickxella alabastrina]|uniref:uncharacterized protein n=1 Tax=Kickxella alabastrina TaxID=61397 RepID=UPI002220AEF5|nr:uncharacterized protein BX661DRAFT_189296 [Kickxella alabastrina]KAI7820347.1 hypothetical protein BX661DRAFT_189296 [Kickxella alabastrina]
MFNFNSFIILLMFMFGFAYALPTDYEPPIITNQFSRRQMSDDTRDNYLMALVGLVGALVAFKVARFLLALLNYFTC